MIKHCLAVATSIAITACASNSAIVQPTLSDFHRLPADSFREGPAAGNNNGKTPAAPIAANNRQAPFEGQPIQGFSAVEVKNGEIYFLSDNGFGGKSNSGDYLLSIYRVRLQQDGTVEVLNTIELSDPQRLAPFAEGIKINGKKYLTGADFDPESFARLANGDFWVGDEFGPFMLHFNSKGELISAPIATPQLQGLQLNRSAYVQSPNNPLLTGEANLGGSGGFEGMAEIDGKLFPLLEKTVDGDPEFTLRLYSFDPADKRFSEFVGYYPVDNHQGKANAIGDITAINQHQFLVIERDHFQAGNATFKKVFLIDINNKDAEGKFTKTLVVDLLNIDDPEDLNQDGSTTYTMPFVTIESIAVVDEQHLLIANDNNYPFSQGRQQDIDDNEVVTIRLPKRLDQY